LQPHRGAGRSDPAAAATVAAAAATAAAVAAATGAVRGGGAEHRFDGAHGRPLAGAGAAVQHVVHHAGVGSVAAADVLRHRLIQPGTVVLLLEPVPGPCRRAERGLVLVRDLHGLNVEVALNV